MRPAELGDDHYRVIPEFATAGLIQRLEFYRHQFAYDEALRHLPAAARVLEVGSGAGYGAAHMRAAGHTVVMSDMSVGALRYAHKRYGEPATTATANQLPFRNASFDALVTFQVIEHLTDAPGFLREVRRVLRPGGILILTTPNRRLRLLPFQKPWNPYHIHEYSAGEFRRLLNRHCGAAQVYGVLLRSDLLELEQERVRQRPIYVYGGMLKRLVLRHTRRQPVSSRVRTVTRKPLDESISISLADFSLTPNADHGVDFFAVVRVRR